MSAPTGPTTGALRLAAWTPDTGTTELPRIHRGQPFYNLETVELHLLDLHPPTLPARTVWQRVATSQAAQHLAAYGWLIGLLLAGLLCLAVTRGEFVTWTGVEAIPGGTR